MTLSQLSTNQFDLIADIPCVTGECPLWHQDQQALYWTDIPEGKIYRWSSHTKRVELVYHDRPVGGMTLQADGSLALFRDRGNVVVFHEGRIVRTVIEQISGLEQTRFNDVIAEPLGGVFAGTMSWGGLENGRLYYISPNGQACVVSDGHATPNGMAFSPDGAKFYFTDSRKRMITLYDYDAQSAKLHNPRPWMQTSLEEATLIGRSDGMTVDASGNIWSARWEGSRVLCFSRDGALLRNIPLPAKNVTSVTFGGDNLCDLFITTAGGNKRPELGELAGSVFVIRAAGQGLPEHRSRL